MGMIDGEVDRERACWVWWAKPKAHPE